jgi:glucokinase
LKKNCTSIYFTAIFLSLTNTIKILCSMIVLSGDIGGTNTRLQLTELNHSSSKMIFSKKYKGARYQSVSEILNIFINESPIEKSQIKSACIAIAGPVINGEVELTNLPWFVTETEIKKTLGINHVKLINDFESIGYGIETLKEKDIYTLQKGHFSKSSTIAYIGAGTGIGTGIVTYHKQDTIVIPTEGGHVDFAPVGDEQTQLLDFLRKRLRRVSLERVCCGIGMVNIYKYLIDDDQSIYTESPEMRLAMYNSEDKGATLSKFAFIHKDPLALKVIDIFLKVYGSSAGNLALSTLPRQGLYIVGGIAPKMLDQLRDGRFMNMFLDKGRMSKMLLDIPVHVCLNSDVGLEGAENYAFKMIKS